MFYHSGFQSVQAAFAKIVRLLIVNVNSQCQRMVVDVPSFYSSNHRNIISIGSMPRHFAAFSCKNYPELDSFVAILRAIRCEWKAVCRNGLNIK